MPRRILQGSSKDQMKSSSSLLQSPVFCFFLGMLAVLVILLILILIFRKSLKQNKVVKLLTQSGTTQASTDLLSDNLHSLSYFDFHTLKKATKNFNPKNLLGQGGFGPVYLGTLEDGRLVAIKKLSLNKSQQGEAEFLSEVRLITSIQHKNLVRLLGCCSDGPQRLLVYEYMENRSLDLIIYGGSDQILNWNTRLKIIRGIAKGLQYLHEDSHLRIIHRDIKASNILLDNKFQPKIGDFGLARGYTAPEYAIRGELSEKADVYSFGVLVLEIISGRKNTNLSLPTEMQYLPEYAWKLYERSALIELVDPKMKEGGFLEKNVAHAIQVALLCLQPHGNLRPAMSEIVAMLTYKFEIVQTPLKPAFLERRHKRNRDLSLSSYADTTPSPLQQKNEYHQGTSPPQETLTLWVNQIH
uniref:Protein kinase domain-containing protein n=1 Tax=Cucumis melo TaxID=3656 RepID=A0A9I9DED8_CUCME